MVRKFGDVRVVARDSFMGGPLFLDYQLQHHLQQYEVASFNFTSQEFTVRYIGLFNAYKSISANINKRTYKVEPRNWPILLIIRLRFSVHDLYL